MLVMILKCLRLSILYQVELVYLHYHLILGYQWYIYSGLHLKKSHLPSLIQQYIFVFILITSCFYNVNMMSHTTVSKTGKPIFPSCLLQHNLVHFKVNSEINRQKTFHCNGLWCIVYNITLNTFST